MKKFWLFLLLSMVIISFTNVVTATLWDDANAVVHIDDNSGGNGAYIYDSKSDSNDWRLLGFEVTDWTTNAVFNYSIVAGADEYISYNLQGTDWLVLNTTENRTHSVWVNGSDSSALGVYLFGQGYAANDFIAVYILYGEPQIFNDIDNSNQQLTHTTSGLNLSDGQWHHVVFTFGDSYCALWVDGVKEIEDTCNV